MLKKTVDIIEIEWLGSFDYKTALGTVNNIQTDYGLYQIYGTHAVFGSDSLLYIGKAQEQKIATRLGQHEKWLNKEHGEIKIYIGRLGSVTRPIDGNQWGTEIDFAERLLIYNCAPPYNTTNVTDFGQVSDTFVINYGKRHRLPFVVSTFSRDGDFYNNSEWKKYSL